MPTAMTPIEMLDRLVAFDTVSRHSNTALITFVADYLRGHGLTPTIIPNEDGSKANLWVTIGPSKPGGVCLSGHTDVVPVDGQDWHTDPFTMVERDGRLYGRGTADMKAFPAIALALVPEMLAAPLVRPIHFAWSYDEEVGCLGVRPLIRQIGTSLPRPSVVIIGEPTSMKVVSAHKGIWAFQTVVTGHEVHSSQTHRGVSAVMTAARLVTRLEDMARERAAAADPACGFDPPYTTIHVGVLKGGTAMNIVSRHAEFGCDIRHLPDDFPEDIQASFVEWYEREILPAMHAVAPGTGTVTETVNIVPGLRHDPDSEAEVLCRQITGDNETRTAAFGTEGGLFQEAGMAAVICGPGSIDQAHQPNEYIEIDQIEAGTRFVRAVIDRCRG